MARRRTARPQRRMSLADRIGNLRDAMPVRDGPTMGDLVLERCETQADVDRVVSWLAKLMRPEAPQAASVCCEMDAARRLHEWDKAWKNASAPDLAALEQQHQCHP